MASTKLMGTLALLECGHARNDLGEFGRDLTLSGPVEVSRQRLPQISGIFSCRLHRNHSHDLL